MTIFCAVGFLVSVGLLCALWRRYFAEVSVWVVAAGALALGLATGVPVLLPQSRCLRSGDQLRVYADDAGAGGDLARVARAGATEAGGWRLRAWPTGWQWGRDRRCCLARVILLVPVVHAWRERQRVWALLMAAIIPITLIGLGLMLYNELRFDNPFEFGQRYQLARSGRLRGNPSVCVISGSISGSIFWSRRAGAARFPFVHEITVPPLPAGYVQVRESLRRPDQHSAGVAGAGRAAGMAESVEAGGIESALVCDGRRPAFWDMRVDSWVLLMLASSAMRWTSCRRWCCWPWLAFSDWSARWLTGWLWRRAVRWGWGLLLGFSVAFNLLASAGSCAEVHYNLGNALFHAGRAQEAIEQYERALQLRSDDVKAQNNLGFALAQTGKLPEAIAQYEQALRIKPDDAETQNNLAWLLATLPPARGGGPVRAVALAEQACKQTNNPAASYLDTLAAAYAAVGRFDDAAVSAEKAIDLARADGQTQLVEQIEARLVLYRSRRAYRRPIDEAEPHNP